MERQDWGSEQYVIECFRDYYSSGVQSLEPPPAINQREFGFLSFGGNTMFRHIGFREKFQLKNYIKKYAPAHSYFSAAYYKTPTASMAEKGWLGADLVFDIDADHFDLSCQKNHDRWTCKTCGEEGKGHPPERCSSCGMATFTGENWLCPNCLDAAKFEATKLLDILIQDFGFDNPSDLSVNFSGNRGYHVHVRSPLAINLDQLSRREIVDYILGTGIEVDHQGLRRRAEDDGSYSIQWGWRERSMKALYDFIVTITPEKMEVLGLSKKASNKTIENRNIILESLMTGDPSKIINYIEKNILKKIMEVAVDEQASAIDTVVTTDLRRLIRLPNTLHGKTGWLTQNVPIDDLPDYDPLTMAVAFNEGNEKVYIRRAPEISLQGEVYGPFEEETRELPLAVAMFLLCRKAARVVR